MGRLPAVLLVALVAGCAAPAQEEAPPLMRLPAGEDAIRFLPPVVAIDSCRAPCHEPTAAVDAAGRVIVANAFSSSVAVSLDGARTFLPVRVPGPDPSPAGLGGDAMVQADPEGAVWFSALATPDGGATPEDVTDVVVARTGNGGVTWDPVAVVRFGAPVDRQWLAFGPGGALLVAVQGPGGLRAAVSRDGGATFGAPVLLEEGARLHGAPAPVGDALLWPRFDYPNSSLAVERTLDGAAFARSVVARDPRGIGAFFPALAADGRVVHAAWKDARGGIRLARSGDAGATWDAARLATREGETAVGSPWLLPTPGGLALVYFSSPSDAGPATLHAIRLEGDRVLRGVAADGVRTTLREDRPGNTDFAHATLLPSGALVVPYADGDGKIRVAVEAR